MEVGIKNFTSFAINKELVLQKVKLALKEEKEKGKVFPSYNISLAFVSPQKARRINKIYRQKSYVPDVLSFPFSEDNLLGEIIICPQKVKENNSFLPQKEGQKDKKEKQEDFTKKLLEVTIHGVLHLLGYTHQNREAEKIMHEKTKYYLNKK